MRNVAKWSWPAVPPPPGTPDSWEVLSNLGARLMGLGGMPAQAVDDFVFRRLAEGAIDESCPWPGLTVDEVVEKLDGAIGPDRIIDMLLRIGPHGDGFGRRPGGLTLAAVQAAAHGIDLGPLQPRLRGDHQHGERGDRARAPDDDRRRHSPASDRWRSVPTAWC